MSQRPLHSLAYCKSCKSEHLAPVPCGLTWIQRMRSVKADSSWMPARNAHGKGYHRKNYYDDEPLKDMFGYDARDRKEIYMDDTKGHGALSRKKNEDPKVVKDVLGL